MGDLPATNHRELILWLPASVCRHSELDGPSVAASKTADERRRTSTRAREGVCEVDSEPSEEPELRLGGSSGRCEFGQSRRSGHGRLSLRQSV